MAQAIMSNQFISDVATILDIPPHNIHSLKIDATVGKVLKVTIDRFIAIEEGIRIEQTIKTFKE